MRKCKKMRKMTVWFLAFCMVASLFPEMSLTSRAKESAKEDEVVIDEENFQDEIFRAYVAQNYDKDGDGKLSDEEAEAVTVMDVSKKEITSLQGIEFFGNLTSLTCNANKLSDLDVSLNTALETLYCQNNELGALDVSLNEALKVMDCSCNQLSSLDVSQNAALEKLNCANNCYLFVPETEGKLDLSELPGDFDVSKASNWKNGSVSGTILTMEEDEVTYTYDCGRNFRETFSIKATEESEDEEEEEDDDVPEDEDDDEADHTHTYSGSKVKITKEATCTEEGIKTYYCTVCDKEKEVPIPKKDHEYQDVVTLKATLTKDGSMTPTCTGCGKKKKAQVISRPKEFQLSEESFVYDGKAKKPTVTVKDAKGEVIDGENYTLSYPKGRKRVGTYVVTLTFKQKYKGKKKLAFDINPAGTKLKSATSASGKVTVKWVKNAKQVTGYEIAYSTSKKFPETSTQTLTAKKNATSAVIENLKAGKTYYVKIRTYKTMGKKNCYYSEWSLPVNVTVKK